MVKILLLVERFSKLLIMKLNKKILYHIIVLSIILLYFPPVKAQLRNPKKCYAMPLNNNPGPANWHIRVAKMHGNWYYHWGYTYPDSLPDSIGWSPMVTIFQDTTVLDSQLVYVDSIKALGLVNSLLGFNEPGFGSKANVHQLLNVWPKLMSVNVPLGSPASTAPTGQGFRSFMDTVAIRHYRVDFICVHWYAAPDSASFINTLKTTYNLYHRPIWITEFAVLDSKAKTIQDNRYSPATVLAFMQKVLPVLDTLSFVQKYFWHNTPYTKPVDWSSALFDNNYNLTHLGKYYSEYQYGVPPPAVPVPVFPEKSSNNLLRLITFKWNDTSFVNTYRIQVATDSTVNADGSFRMQSIVLDSALSWKYDSLKLSVPLDSNTTYYWHIKASNQNRDNGYSKVYFFTTGTVISLPSIPKPVSPPAYVTGVSLKPVFKWNKSSYTEKYEFQLAFDYHTYIDADSGGTFLKQNVVLDTTLKDTSFQLSLPLDSLTRYYWHVKAINKAGASHYSNNPLFFFTTGTTITDVKNKSREIPSKFELYQNYPNPFNPTTLIKYDVSKTSQVIISVYDVLGRKVIDLVNTLRAPGQYSVEFDGALFPSGVYFVRMKAGTFIKVQKIVLVK